MTREVIDQLKKYCDGKSNTDKVEISTMNLNRIIKALEQEHCTDAISREAVLDEMYKRQKDGDAITAGFIKNLPPVQPQPKTGRWIDTGSGQECSECGEIQYGYDNFRHFCANCGRRMEVGG